RASVSIFGEGKAGSHSEGDPSRKLAQAPAAGPLRPCRNADHSKVLWCNGLLQDRKAHGNRDKTEAEARWRNPRGCQENTVGSKGKEGAPAPHRKDTHGADKREGVPEGDKKCHSRHVAAGADEG